ncbi:MAG: DUF4143 domain-containing protein, partial [Bifidobacteriaceae bacterium]|nr:DUF4143 domain-containing protein [Bifidobacteriaceae bacterium]
MYKRNAVLLADELSHDIPVLLLQGPRSVGKSTILNEIAQAYQTEVIDFDNRDVRTAFNDAGTHFLPKTQPVLIDEYQKAPLILDDIKVRLNKSSTPGQFIITGSTSFDALPGGTQKLTGRIHRLDIWPLTQSEILGSTPNIINNLIQNPGITINQLREYRSTTTRSDYLRSISIGGFPLSVSETNPKKRKRWYTDYLDYSINHDIPDILKIRQATDMDKLIPRLSKNTAGVLNVSRICEDIGIKPNTADEYISLLEKIFLIQKLEASTLVDTPRLAKRPKLHFVDSGLATNLLGFDSDTISKINPQTAQRVGQLVETFTINEIIRLAQLNDDFKAAKFWRTRTGEEIDLILEIWGEKTIAIEIKASSTPKST